MLYKGDKGVNNAARPPEGSPAEVGGLSASSLPWNIDCPAVVPRASSLGGNLLESK